MTKPQTFSTYPHRRARFLIAGMVLTATVALGGCAELSQVLESSEGASGMSTESTLARAVKESLQLSSTRAADLLSQAGGYQKSPVYRIKLPESVQPVASRLRQFGLGS